MSTRTKIEWTEQTWNSSTGCTKVSPGCKHCYAEIMARRLKAMGVKGYEKGFSIALHSNRLNEPLVRRKPTMYFVNSMGDLFHEDVPEDFIGQVFEVMKKTPRHTFQVLTKRVERMARSSSFHRSAWEREVIHPSERKPDNEGCPKILVFFSRIVYSAGMVSVRDWSDCVG